MNLASCVVLEKILKFGYNTFNEIHPPQGGVFSFKGSLANNYCPTGFTVTIFLAYF